MFTHCELLPPATKLGQGNIFRSVYQESVHQGRGGVSRPTPKGEVEGSGPHPRGGGSGWGGAVQAHTQGEVEGSGWGGVPGPHPRGRLRGLAGGPPGPHPGGRLRGLAGRGVSGPTPGGGDCRTTPGGCPSPGPGGVSQHALRQTPPQADGYCCGQYASYWNAFLFPFQPSTPGNRTRFSSNDSIWTEIVEQKRNE